MRACILTLQLDSVVESVDGEITLDEIKDEVRRVAFDMAAVTLCS